MPQIMSSPIAALTLLLMLTSTTGCVSTQYTLVEKGPTAVGALQVSVADDYWNRAPQMLTAHLQDGSSVWTRDGILLDRLMLLGPIRHEQTLLKSHDPKTLVFPTFRKEMLPNEIEELMQATLARHLGAEAVVETSNLRPRKLGGQRAVAFDLAVRFADGVSQKGYASATVVAEQLHVFLYLAAQLHYFDKHLGAASAVIDSARVSAQSD